MGYAARQNPNSKWNRKRNANVVKQAMNPAKDEPVIVKINPTNVLDLARDVLCRAISLIKPKTRTHQEQTN